MLLRQWSFDEAKALLPVLVQLTRKEWPDCRSFSGAVLAKRPRSASSRSVTTSAYSGWRAEF